MSWKKPTAGIILAAGMAQRFAGTKQLAKIHGQYLLEKVLDNAQRSRLDRLILVLGHEAGRIRTTLRLQKPPERIQVVVNPYFREGLSRSLQAGLASVAASHPSVMFLLGDQPLIGPALIDLLLERFWQSSRDVCVPVYQGRRGNPVLFSRVFYGRLQALQGDVGGRRLIETCPEQVLQVSVEDPRCFVDIDTPADLQRLAAS